MADGALRRRVATWMLVAACILLASAALIALVSLGRPTAVTFGTQIGAAVWITALTTYPVMGWLIVRREPSHRIGWLLLWIGVAAGFHLSATYYGAFALAAPDPSPGGVVAAWVGNWGWITWIGAIGVFLPSLFPDGRLPSPRWRPLLAVAGAAVVCGIVGEALDATLEVDPRFANPFAVDSPVTAALSAGVSAVPFGVLLGAIALTVRYRRAGSATRAQLRWFLFAVVVVTASFPLVFLVPGGGTSAPLGSRIVQDGVNLLWCAAGAGIGVAVLRYRLYAIDAVINRTLVYGTLTGLLLAAYGGTVFVLQFVLSPLTRGRDIAVAASTLVVFGLFGPLRRRVQTLIDRRFYRSRYDAARLLEGFTARLRRDINLESIVDELRGTAGAAVQPASVSVWLRGAPDQQPGV